MLYGLPTYELSYDLDRNIARYRERGIADIALAPDALGGREWR